MSCLSKGVRTPWSALDGLRLSLPSKVEMSTLNFYEFFLLRLCPKICLLVVWSLAILASTVCDLVHTTRWMLCWYYTLVCRKVDFCPISCAILPSISFILNKRRLCPDQCGLMPSYIIVRRQGSCHILVTDGPFCDWALARVEVIAIVAV